MYVYKGYNKRSYALGPGFLTGPFSCKTSMSVVPERTNTLYAGIKIIGYPRLFSAYCLSRVRGRLLVRSTSPASPT